MRDYRGRYELLIPFIQVVSDFFSIEAAFFVSWWLRFHSPLTSILPVTRGIPSLRIYIITSYFISLLWIFIMETRGMYGVRRNAGRADEFSAVFRSVTFGMLLVAAATFFFRQISYSRLVFVYIWGLSIVLISLMRFSIIRFERGRHGRGMGIIKAAVIGSSPLAEGIAAMVGKHPGLGLEIAGHIGPCPPLEGKKPFLGALDEIPGIMEKHDVRTVFLAITEEENRHLADIVSRCTGLHVEFFLVPDVERLVTSRMKVEQMGGIPLLKIKDRAITGWKSVFKRSFDILFSGLGILLLSPLLLVIGALVTISSKGGTFYRQQRVGMDGRVFDLIKFRSMGTDAESATGPVWTVRGDGRVTSVGRFLRRFSLDELPQLFNVFRGEMSLVGPRPERPHFVEEFKGRVPKYLERHRVRSGMTGWAQVNGLRGDVPIEERTKYDVYYVENWSFMLDIKIILVTVWTVIFGRNSY